MESLSSFVIWNDGRGASVDQEATQPITVIGGICGQSAGRWQRCDQRQCRPYVSQLTWRDFKGQGVSASICYDVDFSRTATA